MKEIWKLPEKCVSKRQDLSNTELKLWFETQEAYFVKLSLCVTPTCSAEWEREES